MPLHRPLLLLALAFLLAAAAGAAESAPAPPITLRAVPASVGDVPVLHQGRVKPLRVAAEEICYALTAHATVATPEGRLAALPACCSWLLEPEAWPTQRMLVVDNLDLQHRMGLPGTVASLADVQTGSAAGFIGAAVQARAAAEESHERWEPTATQAAAIALAERAQEAHQVLAGETIALVPLAPDAAARAWVLGPLAARLPAPSDDEPLWRARLRPVLGAAPASRDLRLQDADIWLTVGDLRQPDPLLLPADEPRLAQAVAASRAFLAALRTPDAGVVARAQAALLPALRAQGERSAAYPRSWKLRVEDAYTAAHPFTWAWLLFILGGTVGAIGVAGQTARALTLRRLGTWLTLLGSLCTVYGLGSRVLITSLGAVTNLYETLIYVALLCAWLGIALGRMTRQPLYAAMGGIAAGLCAMIGEALPPDLGSHIGQLQPVLRSRFWLWTHVKTVVASYAAFTLAWAMGNAVLTRALVERRTVRPAEGTAIYRCLQVGVVLIAAGTLLGAFWASKAWGRFWGWDPKEVYALIILLTYLVPLHLRLVGLIGPTGIAAWSIFGFLSVIMSWYGVNFVLGVGLHAYAFGNGGQGWVASLCTLQLVVTIATLVVLHRRTVRQAAVASSLAAAGAAAPRAEARAPLEAPGTP